MISNVINYSLVVFNDSSNCEFVDALDIYRKTTPRDQKTNSNEIIFWVNNQSEFKLGKLFFLGLKANNKVIGYAEVAYIADERILLIDYLNIDNLTSYYSGFYTFFALIIDYVEYLRLDYDYIIKEIFCRDNSIEINKDDVKQYELENFRVVNTTYIQPILEENNTESNQPAILMIRKRAENGTNTLTKEEYLNLVKTIYKYYLTWDNKICNETEISHRVNLASSNIEKITSAIISDKIVLNGYPYGKYSNLSTNSIIKRERSYDILTAFIYLLFVIALVIALLFILNTYGFDYKATITLIVFCLIAFSFFLSLINDKYNKKIKTFISKIFSALLE